MATHFFSTDVRNRCPFAHDPSARGSFNSEHVTCPACLRAIHAFRRATDETEKCIPAVTRRMSVVS